MIRRRRVLVLLIAGVMLVGLYSARHQLLLAAARWLDVGTPPRHADYVMVLPGDVNTRPFVAAALANAGLARQVLVARPAASPAVEDRIVPPSHEITRRVLLRRGVAEEDIVLLQGQSAGTVGDAQALATFLESAPRASVTVVTNHYHTRRARWILAQVLPGRARGISFVSAPTDRFGADDWWRVDDGFMAVTGEYLKLAYYVARYGSFRYWAVACLALAILAVACRRLRSRKASQRRKSAPAPADEP
jgi:uncharacterized SAM-binding protein YcdF (DUF218 family)